MRDKCCVVDNALSVVKYIALVKRSVTSIDELAHPPIKRLPLEKAQDDIIAELKDSLLSRIEERETELGRALSAEEQQALVKENGHPMLVASRYMPQQYLIGPSMYPFWLMALDAMLIAVGVVYATLAVIDLITRGDVVQASIQAATGYAGTALFWAAIITLAFWIFERNRKSVREPDFNAIHSWPVLPIGGIAVA